VASNPDLVGSIYASWERGDFSSAAWADAEIEFGMADGPEPGSATGRTEMGQRWREALGVWRAVHTAGAECKELDEERVLGLHRFIARGKGSDLDLGPMGLEGACLFHIRDGKVTRLVLYMSRERALAELGLEE
jgi:ketosteroid isomerase-like protein